MGAQVRGATPAFGGGWTEQKLEILEAYLNAYTTALKKIPFDLVYIDAFAGLERSFEALRSAITLTSGIAWPSSWGQQRGR